MPFRNVQSVAALQAPADWVAHHASDSHIAAHQHFDFAEVDGESLEKCIHFSSANSVAIAEARRSFSERS